MVEREAREWWLGELRVFESVVAVIF